MLDLLTLNWKFANNTQSKKKTKKGKIIWQNKDLD